MTEIHEIPCQFRMKTERSILIFFKSNKKMGFFSEAHSLIPTIKTLRHNSPRAGTRRDIVAKINEMFQHADSQLFTVEEVEIIVDGTEI